MTQLQAIIISLQKIPPAPPNLLPRPYYHMTTNDPCSISVQRSQYNIMQSTQVSVTDARHCLNCSLSYKALGDIDHELQPNGHLPGINSASLYPAMNNINAPPPTRYYDDPPHLARVSVRLQAFMSPLLTDSLLKCPGEQQGNQCQHQPDGHRPPETTQYAPMIHVRVLKTSPPFLACTYDLSY